VREARELFAGSALGRRAHAQVDEEKPETAARPGAGVDLEALLTSRDGRFDDMRCRSGRRISQLALGRTRGRADFEESGAAQRSRVGIEHRP